MKQTEPLRIGDRDYQSRLFLGTGKFGSYPLMRQAVEASGTELVTVALRRVHLHEAQDDVIAHLQVPGVHLLPNTSGVRTW